MTAPSPSSLPPAYRSIPSGRHSDALAEAFAGSDVLVPPPPEEGAIPEWHLATGVKPLRPIPQDLADTVRHRAPALASVPPASKTGPRVKLAMRRTRNTRRTMRQTLRVRGWVLRALAMLLSAVAVGIVAGALIEHFTRVVRHG